MKKFTLIVITVFIATGMYLTSCRRNTAYIASTPSTASYGGFPKNVGTIFINKCAVSGCHNSASYGNCDSLLLDTWEHLFRGGVTGSVVVPFSAKYSPLLYFVNTSTTNGYPIATPTMPVSTTTKPQMPLDSAEFQILQDWIANGAPDINGNIAFASEASTRQKIYIAMQGCNLLGVVDAKSMLVMRYIPIGTPTVATESPHDVELSSDGNYAYVPLYGGTKVQKIDTRTDTVVGTVNLSNVSPPGFASAGWSIICMSPSDNSFMVSGYLAGSIVNVQTAGMTLNQNLSIDLLSGGTDQFPSVHGLAACPTFDTFYAALEFGNVINKYSFNGLPFYFKQVSIDGQPPITHENSASTEPDPHQIEMAPDNSKYFVTCQNSNELRIIDRMTDTLIKVIPVGTKPQEMALSSTLPYLFVACMEDTLNPNPGTRGSVYVINYNTLALVRIIYGDFYQPHDIAIDDRDGLIYIPSRNANILGPAAHHSTACTGRPGWYSVYYLNSLTPVNTHRYEVTVDPYAAGTRFK